jgi:hypothetical protein
MKKKELKARIAQLESDLMEVCLKPDSIRSVVIKTRCQIKRDMEKAIWFGNVKRVPHNIIGVVNQCTLKPKTAT